MSLCDRCKNKCKIDVIEIESCINFVGEAPHKIGNNFDRITASQEALAEFICDISFYFPWDDSEFCCRYNIETEQDRLNFVRDWLNEESKE